MDFDWTRFKIVSTCITLKVSLVNNYIDVPLLTVQIIHTQEMCIEKSKVLFFGQLNKINQREKAELSETNNACWLENVKLRAFTG